MLKLTVSCLTILPAIIAASIGKALPLSNDTIIGASNNRLVARSNYTGASNNRLVARSNYTGVSSDGNSAASSNDNSAASSNDNLTASSNGNSHAASSDKLVAVYWGQNSNGDQGTLASYCEKEEVDVVLLAFLHNFPDPLQMNFANMCEQTFTSGLLHCSNIGEDIKKCQSNGKKVLLSLGGGVSNYEFKSAEHARGFAKVMWNKFGEGDDCERPFDDAVVDGFDFDLEGYNDQYTDDFAKALKEQTQQGSKKYLMTSAPQCFLPDFANGKILDAVELDYIFIQFYNNWCSLGPNFNFNEWQEWISSRPVKNAKLFVTLPGAPKSAGSGYVDFETVQKYVTEDMVANGTFGGFAFWDASSVYSNTNAEGVSYIKEAYDYLHSNSV